MCGLIYGKHLPKSPFAGLLLAQLVTVILGRESAAQFAHICVPGVQIQTDLSRQPIQTVWILELNRIVQAFRIRTLAHTLNS